LADLPFFRIGIEGFLKDSQDNP